MDQPIQQDRPKPPHKKVMTRTKRRRVQRARAAMEAKLQAAEIARQEANPPPPPEPEIPAGPGDILEGLPETRFFESRSELGPDIAMLRTARRQRWDTPKEVAQAVLLKAGVKALEEGASLSQVVMVGKLFLDMDGKNQAEEHHQDRMEYYEKALALREKQKEGFSPQLNIGISGGGDTNLHVYIPHNFRDEIEEMPIEPPPELG